jgi:preprotein translocase subunit SecF
MKSVIRFSKSRYFFYAFSALMMLAGVAGYIINGGFNLGVDFKAGIAIQFQIAPASFTVQYAGTDKAALSIPAGEEALTSPGDIIFKLTGADGVAKSFPFTYKDYATVKDLAADIMKKVPGVSIAVTGDAAAAPTELIPLSNPAELTATPYIINRKPGPGRGVETSIAEIRALLDTLGDVSLQQVDPVTNQEFLTRIPVKAGAAETTFQTDTQNTLRKLLEDTYGAGHVIIKSTEYSSARMAQSLASQTVWLVLIAVLAIFVYLYFRFHPWIYGFAGIMGIVHDAIIMLAFDAIFRVEIDTGTIAAILTILGYSINDTIVNFDRVRENNGLMRGSALPVIIDTSVTQNLGRTFITSGATLLTVIALFIMTTGTIKNFSLNMIVGILEGTYSTFISGFIVIEWMNWRGKTRKRDDLKKYGITAEEGAIEGAVEEEEVGEEAPALTMDGQVAAEVAATASETAEDGAAPPTAEGAQAPAAAAAAVAPRPNVLSFGKSGSRKNKKHRRNH